jgi:hypothetical protein
MVRGAVPRPRLGRLVAGQLPAARLLSSRRLDAPARPRPGDGGQIDP